MSKYAIKGGGGPIPDGNGWEEMRNYHPRDKFLRGFGFRIARRPKYGPAVWSFQGIYYTEAQALELADKLQEAARKEAKKR